MIAVEFKYEAVAKALHDAAAQMDDMTAVYTDIAEHMVRVTKERFVKGIDPDGNAWKPKSAVTLAAYEARGDGKRPDPLIGPSKRLSSEILEFVSPDSVEIGSNLEYSAVMQKGAKKGAFGRDSRNHPIPWGDIPARVWLGLSEEDERNILDIVDEHLEDLFGPGE